MRFWLAVVVLCLFSAPSFGASVHDDEWQPGYLRSTSSSSSSGLVGIYNQGHGMITEKTTTWIFYVIAGGVATYQGRQTLKHSWNHPLNVTVRTQIKFAVRGRDLYILDDDGKTQKLELVSKISTR